MTERFVISGSGGYIYDMEYGWIDNEALCRIANALETIARAEEKDFGYDRPHVKMIELARKTLKGDTP